MKTATAAPRVSRQTAGVRRADLLAAATREFALTGLDGTSTEAIARRAGVSQPYLFRLFGTKKALFLATLERGSDRIDEAFREAASKAIADGVDPFDAMGLRYLELLADRDELLLQMQGYAACADVEVRDQVRRRFGDLWTWLGTLPGGDPATVQTFLAMGMLLNVAAAMDLPATVDKQAWAACAVDQQPLEEHA
ncbi:MAG TPA: helix-turn-helix domain-containing protein [Candidatus Dormibacteraeota bacterium]